MKRQDSTGDEVLGQLAECASGVTWEMLRVTSPPMRSLSDRLNEQAKVDADDRDLTSRTDRRRAQSSRETALKDLATELVALKPRQLDRFALSDELLAAIAEAQVIKSSAARNRQVSVVRQHLRDLGPNVSAIEAQLAALKGGPPVPTSSLPPAPPPVPSPNRALLLEWAERLVSDGDSALEAFLSSHPEADRQALRQAARAAVKVRQIGGSASAIERADERLRRGVEPWL